MRQKRLLVLGSILLASTACLISEQQGQGRGQDLIFFFDSGFNQQILYGRTLVFGVVIGWLYNALEGSKGAIVFSVLAGMVLGGWFVRDFRAVQGYRVATTRDALSLEIPGNVHRTLRWEEIKEVRIEGMVFQAPVGRAAGEVDKFFKQLPDWQSLDLVLESGETITMNVGRLSIEQREILWQAILLRGGFQIAK